MTTQTTPATGESAPVASAGEKHLILTVDQQRYALALGKVRGIMGYVDIAAVPAPPPGVRGTVRLHGQTVTVIDLRARFGLPPAARNADSCIIVVEITAGERKLKAGLLVDQVGEVIRIAPQQVRPAGDTPLIAGVAETETGKAALIDLDRLLSGDEASQITKLLAA